jgi:hypothetical protein
MMDDATLLRRYAQNRAESDFAELVRPHLNFVYSAALRQVNGDAHLAQDVTPDAAFETVLWAAAGGEFENVADLLAFDANTRSRSAAVFAELPESIRNELGTPERLIALLVADDVPLGRATVVAQIPTPTDTKVIAQIFDTDGTQKLAQFSLRADGNSWRLVVPEKVVQRYAARFQSP